MPTGEMVREHLEFKSEEDGLVSYQISNNANKDSWKEIYVVYNAKTQSVDYNMEGAWQLAVLGDRFDLDGGTQIVDQVEVPAQSMAVLFRN